MHADSRAPTQLHENALNLAQMPNICNFPHKRFNICFQSDIFDGKISLAFYPISDKFYFVLTNSPHVTTFYIEAVIIGYETGLMLVSFICLGYTRLEAEKPTGTLTPAY